MTNKDIVCMVAEIVDVKYEDVLSSCRKRELVMAREIIAHILCKLHGQTTKQAGKAINRNHSTITHYFGMFADDFKYDKELNDFATRAIETYKERKVPKGHIRGFKLIRLI